ARILKKAINLARKYDIPINVDPKIENFMRYKKVTCITPNTAEAIAGMHYHGPTEDKNIVDLGKKILKKLGTDSVLITRGEKGMTLIEHGNKITHIPTRAKEVYDVTGAGDTVIATFTLALAAKANLIQAAEISNFAAGVVVAKLGTATVSPEELQTAIKNFNKPR
ncbi:MAG: PfkB family carbohydrate kinase, partial [Elusimicrobia bacterium]|nr:PfkB family carbohydrate kinase [Elusimicrobiota bacterium]